MPCGGCGVNFRRIVGETQDEPLRNHVHDPKTKCPRSSQDPLRVIAAIKVITCETRPYHTSHIFGINPVVIAFSVGLIRGSVGTQPKSLVVWVLLETYKSYLMFEFE